jgi:fluoroacetyl-CoA thioesterase
VTLEAGLSGHAVLKVGEADTAIAMGSGSVPVLATPRVLALAEEATCQALAAELPSGSTTVGMKVSLDHLAPTPVGESVTASAYLDKVEGRRLVFSVSVSDEHRLVAAGRVTRVLVDTDAFLAKVGETD